MGRPLPHALRALGHRDFRLFWSGAVISNAGSHMQLAALAWVVAVLTGSALQVTFVTFAAVIPLLLLGPLAGSLADRFSRRRLLLVMQSLQMLQAFVLWTMWELTDVSYAVLVVLALAGGVVAALSSPAWQAIVPALVPRHTLANAVMLNSTQFNIARAVGPMVAGLVLARFDAGLCFLLNALSFLAVVVNLMRMSPDVDAAATTTAGREPFWREFADGYRYVRGHPGLLTAIATNGVVALVGQPVASLLPILTLEAFDAGSRGFGALGGAYGVGAIAGAVLLGRADGRQPPSRTVAVGVAAYAACVLAVGGAPHLAVAVLAIVGLGAAFLMVVATDNAALQALCDDRFRGRVMSLWLMTFGLLYPLGVIVQGALADVVGVRAVIAGDAAVLATFAVVMRARGTFARIDPPGLDDEPAVGVRLEGAPAIP